MSDSTELDRKLIYHCRVFDVYEGDSQLPDGRIIKQSWIDHRPCIAVVPVNSAGNLVLIRQYRHATGGMIVEIPAGNMDRDGESVEACVQRELAEEIVFRAGRLIPLFEGYLVPGYCNEYMYFFLAKDLIHAPLTPDDDEFIETMPVSFSKAQELLNNGEIIDAKTVLGIILAEKYLQQTS